MVRRWSHYSIRQHEALFELDRQLGLGACHEIGGFFQRACTLRSTSQMSLVAASSLGKWPRTRTALRT